MAAAAVGLASPTDKWKIALTAYRFVFFGSGIGGALHYGGVLALTLFGASFPVGTTGDQLHRIIHDGGGS